MITDGIPEAGNEVLEEDVVTVQNKEIKNHIQRVCSSRKTKESGEKNAGGMQNNTKGDQDKDKMSNRYLKSKFCCTICCCSFPYLLCG